MTITTDHAASSYGQPVILDDDGNLMDYGPGIREARRRLGLPNPGALGELLGVSGRTVEEWEQGRRLPATKRLWMLKELLERAASPAE